jgi:ribosomal protein L23
MNPKGIKPTVTNNFKRPQVEIDFVNINMQLLRSPKPYAKNEVGFKHVPFLAKPEIKQYLMKLYNLPVERVDTFNKMGKIMRNSDGKGGHWRKKDWKKSFVKLGFDVDPDL